MMSQWKGCQRTRKALVLTHSLAAWILKHRVAGQSRQTVIPVRKSDVSLGGAVTGRGSLRAPSGKAAVPRSALCPSVAGHHIFHLPFEKHMPPLRRQTHWQRQGSPSVGARGQHGRSPLRPVRPTRAFEEEAKLTQMARWRVVIAIFALNE